MPRLSGAAWQGKQGPCQKRSGLIFNDLQSSFASCKKPCKKFRQSVRVRREAKWGHRAAHGRACRYPARSAIGLLATFSRGASLPAGRPPSDRWCCVPNERPLLMPPFGTTRQGKTGHGLGARNGSPAGTTSAPAHSDRPEPGPARDYAGAAGSVAERFKAPVLKTGKGRPFVSSNLTASASRPSPSRSVLPARWRRPEAEREGGAGAEAYLPFERQAQVRSLRPARRPLAHKSQHRRGGVNRPALPTTACACALRPDRQVRDREAQASRVRGRRWRQ